MFLEIGSRDFCENLHIEGDPLPTLNYENYRNLAVPEKSGVCGTSMTFHARNSDTGICLSQSYKVETRVIQILVSALRKVPKGLEKTLRKAGTTVNVELLQKAALLRIT